MIKKKQHNDNFYTKCLNNKQLLQKFKSKQAENNNKYKQEQEKYTFLTKNQLADIDQFINEIFKYKNNNNNICIEHKLDYYPNIDNYPTISLLQYKSTYNPSLVPLFGKKNEHIYILDNKKVITQFDIKNYTKENLKNVLKKKLNNLKIQFIQNAFANAKSIWQNPNIQQKSLKLPPIKFHKDINKKKIKDEEKCKQNKIKPFYKYRGDLDYKNLIKNQNKLTAGMCKLTEQLTNLKQLDNAKKLKKNGIY